ncbi:nuclear transcription factor Y subunit B-7, partial [Candida albicans P78042]
MIMKLKNKIDFYPLPMVCINCTPAFTIIICFVLFYFILFYFTNLSCSPLHVRRSIVLVGRVMKKALPEHAKLSKESKECIQECVSEFISFITSQAADRCLVEKRKTLNGEDILWAMYTLGFENYSETLKIYLAKYRQYEQEQLSLKPPRKKIRKRKTKSSLSQTQSKEQVDQ